MVFIKNPSISYTYTLACARVCLWRLCVHNIYVYAEGFVYMWAVVLSSFRPLLSNAVRSFFIRGETPNGPSSRWYTPGWYSEKIKYQTRQYYYRLYYACILGHEGFHESYTISVQLSTCRFRYEYTILVSINRSILYVILPNIKMFYDYRVDSWTTDQRQWFSRE